MYFKLLQLSNYSLFDKFQIEFKKCGIHVISGPNGSGKTQIVGSFLIPLFSKNAVSKNPYATEKETDIHLSICGENNQQDIKCSLRARGGLTEYKREIVETNPNGSDLKSKLIIPLRNGRSPSIVFTHRIPNEELNEKDISVINDVFKTSPFQSGYESEYQHILETYCNQKPSLLSSQSQGQRHFLSWLREFCYRQLSTENYPLIVEDELSLYDQYYRHLICLLISVISVKSQVILFTSEYEYISEISDKLVVLNIKLENQIEYQHISCFGYQYGFLENMVQPKPKLKQHNIEEEKYYLDSAFRHEENRVYEFKEVKGNNPVGSIVDVADIYVVAFLNSDLQQNGKILWGITDGDNRIVGVKLNRKQRDDIRKLASERFAQIEPPVAMSIFKVYFHEIYNQDNSLIEDLYVVEITVPVKKYKFFYSTSDKKVFIKTDGGKIKLTPIQLQYELLHRHGINV